MEGGRGGAQLASARFVRSCVQVNTFCRCHLSELRSAGELADLAGRDKGGRERGRMEEREETRRKKGSQETGGGKREGSGREGGDF